MSHPRASRRAFLRGGLAAGASVAFIGPWRRARTQTAAPILVGLTCDETGEFADLGQVDRRGMVLAIEEQNARGGLLGRPIEARAGDTASDPITAARVAQNLLDQARVHFLVGGVSSRIATALGDLAQRAGVVYCNTNASADALTNERCQRVSFAWDASASMLTQALGPLVARHLGTRWLFITHDSAWGRGATAAAREVMKTAGAVDIGETMITPGTRQFSIALLRVRIVKPQVVIANVAGADQTALRDQASAFGADADAHWVFPPQDFPDLVALGPARSFGYFVTTWHHTLTEPGAQEFVRRFRARWAGAPIEVPDNVSCNGYVATRELLRAVERAGTTRSHEVIRQLEGHVIADSFRKHPSTVREWDHLVGQTLYLAKSKKSSEMKDRYDLIELVADVPPELTSRPRELSKCAAPPLSETPARE
jgi:branched-chain amino acid transport system substrate-binding protein